MVVKKRLRKIGREWLAATLGVTALAIAVGVYFNESRPRAARLSISAGSVQGLRHQIAERLASDALRRGLRLKVVGTSGSSETLDRVEAGLIDLGLVQGGLATTRRRHVRQVATLHVEPLHLLVKEELYEAVTRSLEALRGKTVNLSDPGSGTYSLSSEVLQFAGLSPRVDGGDGDYLISTLTYRELEAIRDEGKLPDAIFMVSALPSPVARSLITRHHYRLVPLSFGEAFTLDVLHDAIPGFDSAAENHDVEKAHVTMTEIPAFTYSIMPAVPPNATPTLGTRLLLVAREDADPNAVERIIETVFSPAFAQLARPPLDIKLMDQPPEFEWHQGSLQYLEHNKPLIAGDIVDFMEKGTSLVGALLGGLFFLWQWWKQRYRRKQELGFEAYMLKVTSIERRALELEIGARLDLKELLHLQTALSELKSEALEKFAEGDLEGEELISGFVSHVNDARTYLTRLILHERERLEKQARHEKRSARALWQEVVGDFPNPHSDNPTDHPASIEDLGP